MTIVVVRVRRSIYGTFSLQKKILVLTSLLFGCFFVQECHGFTTPNSCCTKTLQQRQQHRVVPAWHSERQERNHYFQRQQGQQYHHQHRHHTSTTKLLTTSGPGDNNNDGIKLSLLQKAKQKFISRPGTYLMIPVIAAIVGWVTNYMAVQMIFYPVQYWGIPFWRKPEVPLGFLGWQGIVPCKTKTMSVAMVNMVTTQLLTVKEAFGRLDPRKVAQLLAPRVPNLGREIIRDAFPGSIASTPAKLWEGLSTTPVFRAFSIDFLTGLVKDMQQNIDKIFSLESCVVNQMIQDRAKLGELFRKVGHKELDFLTNSGLWFGFLLGLIQMAISLVWENPWALSIGGGIVGLATNWLALKWIFEPINPTKIGPFVLQGQFLRRQKEVAAEFSKFFANKILSSPRLWDSILSDPATSPAFHELVSRHFQKLCNMISVALFKGTPDIETVTRVTDSAIANLPNHLHVIHGYIDKTLGLEETLRTKMEAMSAAKFERVLHPIFEEDELTLILAGAALGFAAGLVQQGLETGAIKLSSPVPRIRKILISIRAALTALLVRLRAQMKKRGTDLDNGQA